MKFWPFPFIRNNSTSPAVTFLFDRFAEDKELKVVSIDDYRTEVKSSFGSMKFWSANRWYAYGSEGIASINGKEFRWVQQMPSRYSVRKFFSKIEEYEFQQMKRAMEIVKS